MLRNSLHHAATRCPSRTAASFRYPCKNWINRSKSPSVVGMPTEMRMAPRIFPKNSNISCMFPDLRELKYLAISSVVAAVVAHGWRWAIL